MYTSTNEKLGPDPQRNTHRTAKSGLRQGDLCYISTLFLFQLWDATLTLK